MDGADEWAPTPIRVRAAASAVILSSMSTGPREPSALAGGPHHGDGAAAPDAAAQARLFLPEGYTARVKPAYFVDSVRERRGVIHQPDVYPYAAAIADRIGASWLIDIGCGRAGKLLPYREQFQLLGIDYGENIRWCRERHESGTWVEWDLTSPDPMPISEQIAREAVVICADVIEHLPDPVPLVRNLASLAERSRAVVVSTPDRALVRGPHDLGPPGNPSHAREWTLSELAQLFGAHGAPPALAGLTRSNDRDSLKHTVLLTFGHDLEPPSRPAPAGFSVQALICAYNEADIIEPVVGRLLAQGIGVHLIDNWSTDGTYERVADLAASSGRATVERFPAAGPSEACKWTALVSRVGQVAAGSTADWVIFQDADEIRLSPWPGVSLRDAIWAVDRAGYNLIDHTVVNFRPVDMRDFPGTDPLEHFSHFEFGRRPGHFLQMKAWKRRADIRIARGGHRVRFEGARIYPLKFSNLHFPIRSHAHGQRKVVDERTERWSPEEREGGWRYTFIDEQTVLVWDAATLHEYDAATFQQQFLTELVAGVNISRLTREEAAEHDARRLKDETPG